MPAADVMRFYARSQIEPFGDRREDIRHSILCHTIAVCLLGRKAPKDPSAFVIDWWKKPQTREEAQAALVKKIERAFGAPTDEGGADGD